jgi:hypothetical protein
MKHGELHLERMVVELLQRKFKSAGLLHRDVIIGDKSHEIMLEKISSIDEMIVIVVPMITVGSDILIFIYNYSSIECERDQCFLVSIKKRLYFTYWMLNQTF